MKRVIPPLIPFVVITLAVELIVRLGLVKSYLLPTPTAVVQAMIEGRTELAAAMLKTSASALIGFTLSAIAGCGALSITSFTSAIVSATCFSGTSNTSSSCTCKSIWALSLALVKAASMRTMARRMMSAAVPCSRALIEARSLKARIEWFEALMSG